MIIIIQSEIVFKLTIKKTLSKSIRSLEYYKFLSLYVNTSAVKCQGINIKLYRWHGNCYARSLFILEDPEINGLNCIRIVEKGVAP